MISQFHLQKSYFAYYLAIIINLFEFVHTLHVDQYCKMEGYLRAFHTQVFLEPTNPNNDHALFHLSSQVPDILVFHKKNLDQLYLLNSLFLLIQNLLVKYIHLFLKARFQVLDLYSKYHTSEGILKLMQFKLYKRRLYSLEIF